MRQLLHELRLLILKFAQKGLSKLEEEYLEESFALLAYGRIRVPERLVDALYILVIEMAAHLFDHSSLLLELAHQVEAGRNHVAAAEARVLTRTFGLALGGARLEGLVQLLDHLVDHDLGADGALVGEIEAEVDRGLADLGLQVAGLLDGILDERDQFGLDLVGLDVSEVGWEGLLGELQQAEVVLEIGVLVSLRDQLEEDFDGDYLCCSRL